MVNLMVSFVNEKANEMISEIVDEFGNELSLQEFDNELKSLVLERATSQLLFSLGNVKFSDQKDITEQFEDWYDSTQRENLKTVCVRCLKEELEKREKTGHSHLSPLEKYLLEHGISLDS